MTPPTFTVLHRTDREVVGPDGRPTATPIDVNITSIVTIEPWAGGGTRLVLNVATQGGGNHLDVTETPEQVERLLINAGACFHV